MFAIHMIAPTCTQTYGNILKHILHTCFSYFYAFQHKRFGHAGAVPVKSPLLVSMLMLLALDKIVRLTSTMLL